MPDEPKKPITEEQTDWDEEPPEWKDAEEKKRVESDLELARRWEREQYEKFHPEARRGDYGADTPAGEPMLAPGVVDVRTWHGTQRPVREFLDDRKWFRMGMVSNFSGPGGIGKTMACLQAGIACAAGSQWLGRDILAGPAMFYSAEEPIEEMHTRVDEICEAEQIHLNELKHAFEIVDTSWHPQAGLIEVSQTSKGLSLSMTPMFHWLKARMQRVKPRVLFIDNRAQVVIGNENDRVVAGFSMRMHAALAKDTGSAVIMLSHPSMSGSKTGASGSTQWFNTARSNVFMTRPGQEGDEADLANLEGDDGKRVLRNNKSNYAPLNTEANVIWEMNCWRCTDQPVKADSGIGKSAMYGKAERVFMDLMKWCAERNIDLMASANSKDYPPKRFGRMPKEQREGFNETWFEKVMFALHGRNEIKIVEKRKNGHMTKFVVIA